MAVADVLARKGYYDELVHTFETLRVKRSGVERQIRDGYEERLQVEAEIAALKDRLLALRKTMRNTQRTKLENNRLLEDLEGGGIKAAIALQMIKFGSMTVEERAKQLRATFRDDILVDRPDSPHAREQLGSSPTHKHSSIQVKDLLFKGPEKRKVRVRAYYGASLEGPSPTLVYFHGEGYIMGDLDTHDWLCRSLAAMARLTVVAVDYRRPPETRFPGAFLDAYAALRWVAAGGLGDGVPPTIGVGGDSAGAALASACCLQARDQEGPEVMVQLLFYPWLDLDPEGQTMQSATIETVEYMAELDWQRRAYAPLPPEPEAPSSEAGLDWLNEPLEEVVEEGHPLGPDGKPWFEDWRASPLAAETFIDLPPAFVAYAEDDPLAQEAERYCERLREECGEDAVHTLCMQGPLSHGFAKFQHLPQAHAAVTAAAAFAASALRGPLAVTMKSMTTGKSRKSTTTTGQVVSLPSIA